ncbi:MAG TPA: alpha/beta hydrolase-fold protein, partial [Candidatus Competibacteraceae bacterium]|nr:alpha/beta hydrolase-fold protein [Candidatus Competibacteraceae bacterium]
ISDIVEDFEINGFIKTVFRHPLPADLIVVDAHVGYYAHGTVLKRLHEDILRPARAHGYKKRWLVGISMGGLGALLYAREYPGDIDGVLVLAPYLGEASLIAEIEAAGDVKNWNHTGRHAAAVLPQLWCWLQGYNPNSGRFPTIYLGFGDRDPFAPANQRLAELLPANHVFVTAGGHDWVTWQRLWEAFLGARAGLPH